MAYTIFSDSTAVIERVLTGRAGPGQALARAVIELERLLVERECTIATRWAPAYRGIEGNEVADAYTKWAAESPFNPVDRKCLQEASLAHLARKTTEARSQSTKEWIRDHVNARWRYRPPRGGRVLQSLQRKGKG